MAKKIGLCLGAGGARGISHIGFLQALEENNIPIDVVTGCSMGSIIGAMYLKGYSPKEMLDIALKLKKGDIIDLSMNIMRNKAILKSQKMDKLLDKYLGETDFSDLKKPFCCIATDLYSGSVIPFCEGDVKFAVRASCSIPVGFTPVPYKDMLLVDGAIRNRIPVAEARHLGADKVIAVDVLGELPETGGIHNVFTLGFRALDILSVHVNLFEEESQRPELLLVPRLGKTSQYKVENQQFCYDRGYEIAIENMDKIKELVK